MEDKLKRNREEEAAADKFIDEIYPFLFNLRTYE